MQRIRIQYKKGEALQYTGNLDLHKVWERTFRRAQIPLAYSQGFHPQPRMHQACPLPLGFTSSAETLDFWCDSEETLDELLTKLEHSAQPGIEFVSLTIVPLNDPALQTIVETSDYQVTLDEHFDIRDIDSKIRGLMASTNCMRERRGKLYDLRSLIKLLKISETNPLQIEMRLSVMPAATGRPEEVLEVLGISPYSVDVERTALTFSTKISEELTETKE